MKQPTLLCLLTALLMSSCLSPQISVEPQTQSNEVQFRVKTKRINSLRKVRFWEGSRHWTGTSKKFLWDVDLHNYSGSDITYGQVPRAFTTAGGRVRSAVQVAIAKPIPHGQPIYMQLEYQYDRFLSACVRSATYSFELSKNGKITNFKKEPPVVILIPAPENNR